jgi:hypothetical protein
MPIDAGNRAHISFELNDKLCAKVPGKFDRGSNFTLRVTVTVGS